MNRAFRLCFLLILLFSPLATSAQKNIQFFRPAPQVGDMRRIWSVVQDKEDIYIAGAAFHSNYNNWYAPYIIKTDTSGKIIWNYTLNKETDLDTTYTFGGNPLASYDIAKMFTDGDLVFVMLKSFYSYAVLAINAKTGNLVWRKLYLSYSLNFFIRDATLTSIMLCNDLSYELINKKDGKTTFQKAIPKTALISFDTDGTTYFNRGDSILQYSSPTLETLVWKKEVITTRSDPAVVIDIIPQNDGYIYYYGKHGNKSYIFCGRLKKSDGSISWLQQPYSGDMPLFDLKDGPSSIRIKDDFIYITAEHLYIGPKSAFHALKIKRSDGTLMWNKMYNASGKPESIYGKYSGLNSSDVDASGNLFAAGYQNESKDFWGEGQWAVVKLDANGNFIYHAVVKDGSNVEGDDSGHYTFVFNNRVYHVGVLNSDGSTVPYIVSTDTSGVYLPIMKSIPVSYQEPGSVRGIATLSAAKYVIYRQSDRTGLLELRNSSDHSLIWSKKISVGGFYKADRLSVSKENEIAVTAFLHGPRGTDLGAWEGGSFDYATRPDSIIYIKFDSAGNQLKYKKSYVGELVGMRSVQLLSANKSASAYIFSAKFPLDWGRFSDHSYSMMNLDKSDGKRAFLGGGGGVYRPYAGSKKILLPYLRDSTILGYSNMWYSSASVRKMTIFMSSYLYGDPNSEFPDGGNYGFERRLNRSAAEFKNLSPFDSTTMLILAADLTSGNDQIIRYNIQKDSIVWTHTTAAGIELHNASSYNKSTYYIGNKSRSLIVHKLDNTTGDILWERMLTPPGPDQYYVPVDEQINKQLQHYTVCGYIADSSYPVISQIPFYVTYDAMGNIVEQWSEIPQHIVMSQLNTIAVTQYGQTLIGGALYTLAEGKAGVLITTGDAIPSVQTEARQACPGSSISLPADSSGQSYQWQQDKGFGYEDLEDGIGISGTHSASLRLLNISSSSNGYIYRCLVDGKSNKQYLLETGSFPPSIAIEGDTLINAGAATRLTAVVKYVGDQPSYLWEDSTAVHTWAVISGATSNTLNYKPGSMKTKVRCTVTSSMICAGVNKAMSEVFRVSIDPVTAIDPDPTQDYGIHFYPNPVTSTLTIDSMATSDQWKTVDVWQLNGKMVHTQSVSNQIKISIPAKNWAPGIYVFVLRNSRGTTARFKFVKLK